MAANHTTSDNRKEQEAKELSSKLRTFFNIIESKPHAIVDDTSLEKFFSLLFELSTTQICDTFNSVVLDWETCTLDFLGRVEAMKAECTLGFALRLSALIVESSEDKFNRLKSTGILSSIYDKARTNILTSESSKMLYLQSSFLKALKTVSQKTYTHSWILETGLLDVSLHGFTSSSYYIGKEASDTLATFISSTSNYMLPSDILLKMKSCNESSSLCCLLNILEYIHIKCPDRTNLFLADSNIFMRIILHIKQAECLPKELILKTVGFLERLLSSERGCYDAPVLGFESMDALLLESMQLLHHVGKRDILLIVQVLSSFSVKESKARGTCLRNWNSDLLHCHYEMLLDLDGSADSVIKTSNEERFGKNSELSFIVDCFTEKIRTVQLSKDSVGLSVYFTILLQSIGKLISMIYKDTICEADSNCIQKMIHSLMNIVNTLQPTGFDTKTCDIVAKVKGKGKERILLQCFDLILVIINSQVGHEVHTTTFINAWNTILRMVMSASSNLKVFQLCGKMLPRTIEKICAFSCDENHYESKRIKLAGKDDFMHEWIKVIGLIIEKGLNDDDWGVRDNALDLALETITRFHEPKMEFILLLAFKNEIWVRFVKKILCLLDDENSYVKATVIKFISEIHREELIFSTVMELWGISEEDILLKCIDIMKFEGEAFPRRAAIDFFKELVHNKVTWKTDDSIVCPHCKQDTKISFTFRDFVLKALDIALSDFDWEVRQGGLQCLERLFLSAAISCGVALTTSEPEKKIIVSSVTTSSRRDESMENGVRSRVESVKELGDILHLLNISNTSSLLRTALDDYDVTVMDSVVRTVETFQCLIKPCIEVDRDDSYGRELEWHKDFVRCIESRKSLSQVFQIDLTAYQSDLKEPQPTIVHKLSSFLTDVISATENTQDNLLDCY